MKTLLKVSLLLLTLAALHYSSYSQVPQKISYQAVIRSNSNALLRNRPISMRISIIQSSPSGTPVYEEIHTTSTNSNGLVSIEIGGGTVINGNFTAIAWRDGEYYIKTETDTAGGNNYSITGVAQILSVPYALYAQNSETGWSVNGNSGTVDGHHYIGTNDNIPINMRVNNQKAGRINSNGQTILGYQAGNNNTAANSTFIGSQAGYSNTTGDFNTVTGNQAFFSNTTGYENTSIGYQSLYKNIVGNQNTSIGVKTLYFNTTGVRNTAVGNQALLSNTGGKNNTAIGFAALYYNTSGISNTAIGYQALFNNKANSRNTAVGCRALFYANDGATGQETYNTALGYEALRGSSNPVNNTGRFNTAVGDQALFNNTSGFSNTALGTQSLYSNTSGKLNIAIGDSALFSNTQGSYNIALGTLSLNSNTSGWHNLALGPYSLNENTTGSYNLAIGLRSLYSNISGSNNLAIGFASQEFCEGSDNTAIGISALRYNVSGTANTGIGRFALGNNSTGSYNVAIGYNAGKGNVGYDFNQCTFVGANTNFVFNSNASNITLLGFGIANGECTGNNQVCIGNTAVTKIKGQVNFTTYSDRRFKNNIREDVIGLPFIMRLKPVSFNENPEILHQIWGTPDSLLKTIDHTEIKNMRFVGLIAQDVEQAMLESGYINFPGIDIPRSNKEVYALRYTDLIMPMIKALQEQEQIIEKQKMELDDIKSKLNMYETRLKSLEEKLQKN